MLDMMARCGIQWQRRYGARFGCWHEEEIQPPGIALVTGITVHKTVEANLRNKIETEGSLLPRGQIEELARSEFGTLWNAGMMLTESEAENVNKTFGAAVDQTIALSVLHHDVLAPQIQPLAVEEKFVIVLKGFPYDLAGMKDVREKDAIRDTKTKAASPPEGAARSMQMATYCLAERVERGRLPAKVYLDFLVKTKTPKVVIREAVPDDSWIQPLLRRVERATELIESVREGKGAFTPADPEHWCCTQKFCGYAKTCPFWSGK